MKVRLALLGFLFCITNLPAAMFTSLPFTATAVSGDGSTILGYGFRNIYARRAFDTHLGGPFFDKSSVASTRGISYTGDVGLYTYSFTSYGPPPGTNYVHYEAAYLWQIPSTIGSVFGGSITPLAYSSGIDISADGSIAVGAVANGSYLQSSSGVITISNFNVAAISSDGSTLVGTSGNPPIATYWRTTTGLVSLGTLTGDSTSQACDVSSSGSTIVGASGSRAMRWSQDEGMVSLGTLDDGTISSVARAVSQDGSIVVGQVIGTNGPQAFIWDATNGMRSLEAFLVGNGATISAAHLTDATGISANGHIIIGAATNEAGGPAFPWVASLDTIAPPDNVTAVFADEPSRIVVSWKPSQNSGGYIVERRIGTDGNWEQLGIAGVGTNSLVDQNITTTNYFYRVLAANVVGQSAPSAEVEQSGYRRYLFQNRINGGLQIWFAAGTNVVSSNCIAMPSLAGWRAAALGDLNRDGASDVILQNSNGAVSVVFLQDTNFLGSAVIQSTTNKLWKIVGCADYNADANLDLVWQHPIGYVAVSFLNKTNVGVRKLMLGSQPLSQGTRLAAIAPFTGDWFRSQLNGDSTPDFVLQNGLARPIIWRMHGLGHTRTQYLPAFPKTWRIVGVCSYGVELNMHQVDNDILFQKPDGGVVIWPTYGTVNYSVGATPAVTVYDGAAPGADWRLVGAYQ
jgi:hypothetical protein